MTRGEQLKMLSDIANALVKQDLIMDKLDEVANGQENILKQLKATHLGHEEDWGQKVSIEDAEFYGEE